MIGSKATKKALGFGGNTLYRFGNFGRNTKGMSRGAVQRRGLFRAAVGVPTAAAITGSRIRNKSSDYTPPPPAGNPRSSGGIRRY